MKKCPNCGQEIQSERLQMGFRICVKCSTEEKYGVLRIFEGKTADTIQVIKDRKLAERLNSMQKRSNFGVADAMFQEV